MLLVVTITAGLEFVTCQLGETQHAIVHNGITLCVTPAAEGVTGSDRRQLLHLCSLQSTCHLCCDQEGTSGEQGNVHITTITTLTLLGKDHRLRTSGQPVKAYKAGRAQVDSASYLHLSVYLQSISLIKCLVGCTVQQLSTVTESQQMVQLESRRPSGKWIRVVQSKKERLFCP